MAKARAIKNIKPEAPAIRDARRIILVRLEELLSWTPYIDDPANVPEIHHMRIAAKRLRYTLELFRPILPKGTNGLIDEVKEIQEHIGTMHDADVMIEHVVTMISADGEERMARMLDIATAVERGTVAQRRQRMRSAAVARQTVRDEVSLYTLVAQHADRSDAAYHDFLRAWNLMMETDYVGRLRRHIGVDPALEPEAPAKPPKAKKNAGQQPQAESVAAEQAAAGASAEQAAAGASVDSESPSAEAIAPDDDVDATDAEAGELAEAAEAPTEVEAKLAFDEDDEPTLLTLTELGGLALQDRRTIDQADIYLDTTDRALEQERATVRVRRIGDEWRMTFKGPSVYHQVGETTVKSRSEDEIVVPVATATAAMDDPQALDDDSAPSPLRRARALTGGDDLVTIARIENRRSILTFAGFGGESVVELMIDRCIGTRFSDGRIVTFDELEAEVRSGDISVLHTVLDDLRQKVPSVRSSVLSKLGRVMGDDVDDNSAADASLDDEPAPPEPAE